MKNPEGVYALRKLLNVTVSNTDHYMKLRPFLINIDENSVDTCPICVELKKSSDDVSLCKERR